MMYIYFYNIEYDLNDTEKILYSGVLKAREKITDDGGMDNFLRLVCTKDNLEFNKVFPTNISFLGLG